MISSRSRFALAMLPAVVTLILVAVALGSGRRLTRAVGWVDHTGEVIQRSNALLVRTLDAETGERGYLVTGDTIFLRPYDNAEPAARKSLDELRTLTTDNPGQALRIDTLARELAVRFAILDSGVVNRRTGRFQSIVEGSMLRHGRQSMDRVRRLIADIQSSEQRLLDRRRGEARRGERVVRSVLLLGGLVAVVVAIAVNVFLARILDESVRMSREMGAQLDDLIAARRELGERNRPST